MLCRALLRKTLSGEGRQRLSKLGARFQGWCCGDDAMADPTPRRTLRPTNAHETVKDYDV